MKTTNALKSEVVTHIQIEGLLAARRSLDALTHQCDLLEDAVRATEQEFISLVESGAEVRSNYRLMVRSTERRYPAWKERYSVLASIVPSAPSPEDVLANTPPTTTKSLVIK